jgi:uncharacterized protein YcnI
MKTQSIATCVAILCVFSWIGLDRDGDATAHALLVEEKAPTEGSWCTFQMTEECDWSPTHTIRIPVSQQVFYMQC